MNQGRCLCGTVQYETDGEFVAVVHCHCSMCRKHHGAPFATWAVVPAAGYRVTAGADVIARHESSPGTHRSFCRRCGSVTPEQTPTGGHVVIPAGNLGGDLPAPQLHMFVRSRAPWYTIADDLPQHEAWPPGYGTDTLGPTAAAPAAPGARGSCLCDAVAFEIDAAPLRFMYCHCSRCRRGRSAAHGANLFYPLEALRWLRGEDLVVEYAVPDAKHFRVAFCRRCGGAAPHASRPRNVAVVPAGSLDTDPGLRPQAHIYVASGAPWERIGDDGVPRFAELPPS